MHPKLNQRYFLLLIILVLILYVPGSLCQNGREYATCGAPYRCGDIQNVTYPFWGGSRPEYCGFSGFQLTCQGGVAFLNILSIRYRVLEINNTARTLKVAREDLWTTACPRFLYNTTLDLNLFTPSPGYRNITLYYGCSLNGQPTQLLGQFSCNVNGTNTTSFYVIEEVPTSGNTIRCDDSIYVPINQTYQSLLALPTTSVARLLQDAFVSGFLLQWEANNSICQNCVGSGGLCGTNRDGSFACYCANRTSALTCNDAPTGNGPNGSGNSDKTGMSVGLSIGGAVLAGVGLGWLIFHYRQKKKQRLAAQPTETVSKDLPPPSKSISTPPSTTFTKSIPSYPSSKSDFGRASSYFGVQVFSYNELDEATNNFDPSRELGDGGFGTVYYAVLTDGRVVAVKRLYENNFKRVEQFMNEVEILTRLRHQNLVTFFGVVLIELISSLQAVDTNRQRHDVNLANMAVNKIQNQTLHELIDSSLGFETNNVVRRMATLVAELAFRCLQQERDMRPSMEEVLKVLRGIQNGDLNAHEAEVVDILIDDNVGLLKGSVAPSSPDSVH
ncbi:unnamed protein product [Fraxinus pennsylvanica]|uniref:non-specific serine/threonine protein kinase n=1 Tax=Fraxinus pennsylvanica TaxID=56036 RepID=A0AAD2DG11_9LAMI|nr:unnamed protein product [Fraxinus pennsylvanica]